MIRLVTLAALAVSVALPASAHEIRVSLASKTPAQIQADINAAARSVCLRATSSETFRVTAFNACVKATVADSLAKASPVLAAARGAEIAQR